jgi:hypothetical protein
MNKTKRIKKAMHPLPVCMWLNHMIRMILWTNPSRISAKQRPVLYFVKFIDDHYKNIFVFVEKQVEVAQRLQVIACQS